MTQRNIYSIAHRCNTPEDVRSAFEEGANAVECDVIFDKGRFYAQHGPDAKGTKLISFLQEIKKVADKVKERFALIIFDLKETVNRPGLKEVHKLVESLFSEGTRIKVIYSVSSLSRGSIFKGILPVLDLEEALSIDENDYPRKVQHFFEGIGIGRSCYGNGITAALPEDFGGPIRESIRKAVLLKMRRRIIKLVYIWTIDLKATMRAYLDLGVDGIMTNHIGSLQEVLREKKYQSAFRLATRSDAPFAGEALPRYLINERSKTIHDLNNEKGDCHVDRIGSDRRLQAPRLTRQIGFSRCRKCFPS